MKPLFFLDIKIIPYFYMNSNGDFLGIFLPEKLCQTVKIIEKKPVLQFF